MRQTFRDLDGTSGWRRLYASEHRGWFSLGGGLLILGALLVGNLAACTAVETLKEMDTAAFRQPPQWLPAQRMLYQPYRQDQRVEPYTPGDGGDLDDLLGGLGAASNAETPAPPEAYAITTTPSFSGTVSRPYRYRVAVGGDPPGVTFGVSGPDGLTVDASGQVAWTPEPGQAGRHRVAVTALGPEGAGSVQTYTLVVSERYHPLGTDAAGRDLLATLVLGSRWAVGPGLVAVAVALLLGLLLGAPAGYYEGRLDVALGFVTHLSEALPALVLFFVTAVVFQFDRFGLVPVMVVLGLVLAPGVARSLKAKVKSLKARQFIEASRELGLGDAEILWRDIVWYNARTLILERAFYGFALAVALEVTMSYLGIGIQPPDASWGLLIRSGRDLLNEGIYWVIVVPALVTVVVMAGYYWLGNGLVQILRARKT